MDIYKWVIFVGILAVGIFSFWIFTVTKASGLAPQRTLDTPSTLLEHEGKKRPPATYETPPVVQETPRQDPPSSVGVPAVGPESEYFSIDGQNSFHRPSCPLIRDVPKYKLTKMTRREDAVRVGFTPCPTCGP